MAQFNFSCPHCNQLVQADDQWTGQQIQCPVCAGGIIVPQNPAAASAPPPPPPSAPSQPQKPVSKLKVSAMGHGPAPSGPSAPPPPSAPRPNYAAGAAAAARPKKKDTGKWVKMAVGIIACGVGFYFAFGMISKWQAKLSESSGDDGGMAGQAGHIVALNDVLDRTDPDHMGMSSKEAAVAAKEEARLKARYEAMEKRAGQNQTAEDSAEEAPVNAVANATKEMAALPLASGIWSMEADPAIPEGRANGMISGTNFVVDTAALVKVGPTQILTLREGTNLVSDRELFVSFQLPTGEELGGHTFNISQDMKGKGVPQVVKRWKTNPRFAPSKKSFLSGYAMKLEFGHPTNGIVAGKISVSLPDPEQSYVVGAFKAAVLNPAAPQQ